MAFGQRYLEKHQFRKFYIAGAPSGLLRYIIIIPAICEPGVFETLESIRKNKEVKNDTEVYILVNWPDTILSDLKEQNKQIYIQICEWCSSHSDTKIKFFAILADDLPANHAGVGLARKIAMDIAIERFDAIEQASGFILSLDADTLVPDDYLYQIEIATDQNKALQTLIFNFEHPIEGNEYSPAVYQAIALYELHMRYYRQMLIYCGFPYSHFTIGSCFGVRADLYTKIGGMNRRKGAEDFYFLHKTFPHENVLFFPKLILIPSSRPSWRVPFGTGPTVRRLIGNPVPDFKTFNPISFETLKVFFQSMADWSSGTEKKAEELTAVVDSKILDFLGEKRFVMKINEIVSHTARPESFKKRFFQWFDGLMLVQFLNWHAEHGATQLDLLTAIKNIPEIPEALTPTAALKILREKDKV